MADSRSLDHTSRLPDLMRARRVTDREFHDAILHENSMPVELLCADLEHLPLTRDYPAAWKFYRDHPTHPRACFRPP